MKCNQRKGGLLLEGVGDRDEGLKVEMDTQTMMRQFALKLNLERKNKQTNGSSAHAREEPWGTWKMGRARKNAVLSGCPECGE